MCVILGKTPQEVASMTLKQVQAIHRAHVRMELERNERDANAARAAQCESKGFREYTKAVRAAAKETLQ